MKHQELGIKLTALRKAKGLTQDDLVAKCNIKVRTLQRIEAGEVFPRNHTLQVILSVLEVDYADFIGQIKLNTETQCKFEIRKHPSSFETILEKLSFPMYILMLLVFSFVIKVGMPWYFNILPVLIIFLINTDETQLETD